MIAAISMVRNEADIIESFVRHTLTFADRLFIGDHNSTDNTVKIIERLKSEGLPISVINLPDIIGHEQAEITTMLMEAAFEVTTDGYTVNWPEGQDICPDELYAFSKDSL